MANCNSARTSRRRCSRKWKRSGAAAGIESHPRASSASNARVASCYAAPQRPDDDHAGAARHRRDRTQRKFPQARLPGEELPKVYQSPARSEGIRGAERARGRRRRHRARDGHRAGRVRRARHAQLSQEGVLAPKPENIEKVARSCVTDRPCANREADHRTDQHRGDPRDARQPPGSVKLLLGTEVTRIEPARVYPAAEEEQRRRLHHARPRSAARFLSPQWHPDPGEWTPGWISLVSLRLLHLPLPLEIGRFCRTWLKLADNIPAILSSIGGHFTPRWRIARRSWARSPARSSAPAFTTRLPTARHCGLRHPPHRASPGTPYVTVQTLSLMLVQVLPLFLLP